MNEVFATGLNRPFGIAFYPVGPEPKYVYVGNTDSVVRFPYKNGDTKARGSRRRSSRTSRAATNASAAAATGRGTWSSRPTARPCTSRSDRGRTSTTTRREKRRADILAFDPDGKNERIFASGIRNPVGLAMHPKTGQLWTSVNERDGLGDNLVPDYITHVEEGGFYGWPWYYLGPTRTRAQGKAPRAEGQGDRPRRAPAVAHGLARPDVLRRRPVPEEYRHDAFASEHGSWNRARRTGYKVIRVPMKDGKATGEYEDFLVGFVTKEGNVWGRPVGVAVAKDGSLMVTDDGSGTVWRVAYTGKK